MESIDGLKNKTSSNDDLAQKVRERLVCIVGYEESNARDKALYACRVYASFGVKPPAWYVLREVIGGGSASYVQAGINLFYAEGLRGTIADGRKIPHQVEIMFEQLWGEAVAQSSRDYEEQKNVYLEKICALEKNLDSERSEKAKFCAENENLKNRIQILEVRLRLSASKNSRLARKKIYMEHTGDE
jgi:hypothetical protein